MISGLNNFVIGRCFISGIASSYELHYNEEFLGNYIKKGEFEYIMKDLNAEIFKYWPCTWTIWLGYLLAPFTLGVSFFIPNLCIKDAKYKFLVEI